MWVRKDENRFRRRVLMHLPTWALRFIARYYGARCACCVHKPKGILDDEMCMTGIIIVFNGTLLCRHYKKNY